MTPDEHADDLTAEGRQTNLMAKVPALYTEQPERLAYDIALNLTPLDELFEHYGMTHDEGVVYISTPAFVATLLKAQEDVEKNGLTFKAKAKLQAEQLLAHSFQMATDPLTSAAVRADLIKSTVKWAGYEPKGDDAGKTAGGGLTLNISFAGQPAQSIVTREPVTIEQ